MAKRKNKKKVGGSIKTKPKTLTPLTNSQIVKALDEEEDNNEEHQAEHPNELRTVIYPRLDGVSAPDSVSVPLSPAAGTVFDLQDVITAGGSGTSRELNTSNLYEDEVPDNRSIQANYEQENDIFGDEGKEQNSIGFNMHIDKFGDVYDDSSNSIEITSELSDLEHSSAWGFEGESKKQEPAKKRKLISIRRVSKGTGRNQDPVWENFQSRAKGVKKVKCKGCNQEVSARAWRLKHHVEKCPKLSQRLTFEDVSVPAPTPPKAVPAPSVESEEHRIASRKTTSNTSRITAFVDRMSAPEQVEIDNLLGKFIFGSNLPFRVVENKEFVSFVKRLHPAYEIPKRRTVQTKILDQIFDECCNQVGLDLKDKRVTIQQDGWSTQQNAPVIAHSVSTGTRNFFISGIATETNSKNAAYCLGLLETEIDTIEEKYQCKVIGSITDNCATMRCMRDALSFKRPDMFIYGCHSHLLNLVGQELTPENLKAAVVDVQKFFRNHHFASASLKQKQGNRPILPGDTRWNSQLDCFQSFLNNQTKYLEISREPEAKMPDTIKSLIRDNNFYEQVSQATRILQPVADALDKLQGDRSTLADAVALWLALDAELGIYNENQIFKEKFSLAMTPIAIIAYMLHPKYRGKDLPLDLKSVGNEFLSSKNPHCVIAASELKIKSEETFPKALLDDHVVSRMNPANWWKSVGMDIRLPVGLLELASDLMSLPSSTGGLERSFSALGRIMTSGRSRLGVEKAVKLCFIYSCLNSKDASVSLFADSDLD